MNSKQYYSRAANLLRASLVMVGVLSVGAPAYAGSAAQAPDWMHALASAPMPAHDEKDSMVVMYDETNLVVDSVDHMRTIHRRAFRILRPDAHDAGNIWVSFNRDSKVTHLRGWCIPAKGADYEVKDKEAIEAALRIDGGDLVNDTRNKVIVIPAAEPGNLIGYEAEVEEHPLALQDIWVFQEPYPVRESRYKLTLPAGWEYKATWANFTAVKPTEAGTEHEWVVHDIPGVRKENEMPPMNAVTGHLVISFYPTGSRTLKAFSTWQEMGAWADDLVKDRLQASPEIQTKVVALTAGASTQLAKMQAIARFVQTDVRYVSIQLGIGGWQPHPAAEVFSHRYGDCKDKATLMRSMLREIGITETYHVSINTERGAMTPSEQPWRGFDHAIIAIRLPAGLEDFSLQAVVNHPKLGRLLFFDPTNEYVPLGEIPNYLQASYALVSLPNGGEMIEIPRSPAAANGVRRAGTLTLDVAGGLHGSFEDIRLGARAAEERYRLNAAEKGTDRSRPVEQLLAHSFTAYQLTSLASINVQDVTVPLGYRYSVAAPAYAKYAGDLLLVRPRVLGTRSSGLLEEKEPRKQPVEFVGPELDSDSFEITIPPGFVVDDLPPPSDADYAFASYHSKTEVAGNVLKYQRTFEIKELKVEMAQMGDLKKLYRLIASDERNTAVLKKSASATVGAVAPAH